MSKAPTRQKPAFVQRLAKLLLQKPLLKTTSPKDFLCARVFLKLFSHAMKGFFAASGGAIPKHNPRTFEVTEWAIFAEEKPIQTTHHKRTEQTAQPQEQRYQFRWQWTLK